jgi:hypothetical protein
VKAERVERENISVSAGVPALKRAHPEPGRERCGGRSNAILDRKQEGRVGVSPIAPKKSFHQDHKQHDHADRDEREDPAEDLIGRRSDARKTRIIAP